MASPSEEIFTEPFNTQITSSDLVFPAGVANILLEDGSNLLLENGSRLLLE